MIQKKTIHLNIP